MKKFDILIQEREFWTTQDGRKIAIEDMGNSHLRNTISMLAKKGFEHNALGPMWKELVKRNLHFDARSPHEFHNKFENIKFSHNSKMKRKRKGVFDN